MKAVHVRLENAIYNEIESMAKERGVNQSLILRELIDVGLRVKKHMENQKSGGKEEDKLDSQHVETGASAAIETLILLRKIANNTNPDWASLAHKEAAEKIEKY